MSARRWCSNCERMGFGGSTHHTWRDCPRVTCYNCQRKGHLGRDCPGKPAPRSSDVPSPIPIHIPSNGPNHVLNHDGGQVPSHVTYNVPSHVARRADVVERESGHVRQVSDVSHVSPPTVVKALFVQKSPSRDVAATPNCEKRPRELNVHLHDLHPHHPTFREALGSFARPSIPQSTSPVPQKPRLPLPETQLPLHICSNCRHPSGAYTTRKPQTQDASVQTSLW